MELCKDYIKHAMMAEAASGDEPDDPSSTTKFLNDPFTKTFMDGMAAQKKHTTIDELDQDVQDDIDGKSDDKPWGSPESEPPEEPFEHVYMTDSEEQPTGSFSHTIIFLLSGLIKNMLLTTADLGVNHFSLGIK